MTRCEACHGPIGAHENPHWFGGATRYHPGDTTEVLDALLSAITSASAPAGGHVLDLPRVGEADRG